VDGAESPRNGARRREDVWIPGGRKPDESADPVEGDEATAAALERVIELKRANSLDAPSERASDRFDRLTLSELTNELAEHRGPSDWDDDEDDE
jgi:hypothetical protein